MYFTFFKLMKWGKKTAETRRRNCVVPLIYLPCFFGQKTEKPPPLWAEGVSRKRVFRKKRGRKEDLRSSKGGGSRLPQPFCL